MRKKYVLIDYENVQPETIEALEHEHIHVLVFVGAKQAKITFDVASVVQRMGERATYIKITGSGNNALDFHIAYYIGQLAAKDPHADLYIVSKDTGFDPLLQHLKSKRISVSRMKSVMDLPRVNASASKSNPDRVSVVVANLKQRRASNPRTLKTLGSTINALFQKSLSEAEITGIIMELKKKGIVAVNESRVSYSLPDGESSKL